MEPPPPPQFQCHHPNHPYWNLPLPALTYLFFFLLQLLLFLGDITFLLLNPSFLLLALSFLLVACRLVGLLSFQLPSGLCVTVGLLVELPPTPAALWPLGSEDSPSLGD